MTQAKVTLTHEESGVVDQYPVEIITGLSRFIHQAHEAYPDWEYVRVWSNTYVVPSRVIVLKFNVLERGKVIGSIAQDFFRRHTEMVILSSPKIYAERKANCITTRSIKTAITTAKKYFAEQSVEMALKMTGERAAQVLSLTAYAARQTYHVMDRRLDDSRGAFVITHWDAFMASITDSSTVEIANGLGAQADKIEILTAMEFQFTNGGGLAVHIRDGVYTMKHGDVIKSYTREEVSTDLLYKIGMLKLSSKDDITTSVGYRAGDYTFHIFVDTDFKLE